MYPKLHSILKYAMSAVAIIAMLGSAFTMAAASDGTSDRPLRVVLIPADGGTEDGTRKDFEPIFNAISEATGLNFELKVGQSYGAVVEAMCNGSADIAWFGPVSYLQAHDRGCANLLAMAVRKGGSVYYSGIFARKDSGIDSITDIRGKRIALGDVNSTSSFNIPVAMLLREGVDPASDTAKVNLAGSHANVLSALSQGLVDVGGASFDSYEKALNAGAIDGNDIKVIAKSAPLPYPPLAIQPEVSADVKSRLRKAFNNVHTMPGIKPEQIRGYGGKQVDRYTSDVSEETMAEVGDMLNAVTRDVKQSILAAGNKR
ncbi:phosphate/phosphite/phosphonate ABC transporter substrate-binding protein [Marinobacter persicus]|uniref:Phosphonate transport system substrate-binding protein n=1 Tax=Marinobacter persicus TaxID=930118 RepID=A0A2S6G5G2_9GAMM|nr:phosphate/phosphite/phosphonate ABC transporter substrate-binding protein [Marinobacter persicus]PPK51092.1 phosphonate transport system substrate-binding protein [Marinobacter persicus]PPK54358.1 phosphonate transport system substrate-binding protein [Marinobacter persicus]PPK57694.1 phosphonate transport system substrate-binding protein [Marinobacter persicus]